jgi:hypothetical protein
MVTHSKSKGSVTGTSEPSTVTPSIDTPSTSVASTGPDRARVFVRLENGIKILVPVSQDSTVHDLHVQTLRRAKSFGVRGTTNDTTLGSTGSDRIVFCGEDSLADTLEFTNSSTFTLGSFHTAASQIDQESVEARDILSMQLDSRQAGHISAASYTSSSSGGDSSVYIRWISLEAAMGTPRLRKIPIDKVPIPCDTTMHEFHQIAIDRLCGSRKKGSCTNPQQLNLFLRECQLYAKGNPATFTDMGLRGSKHAPLDIFVEFIGPEDRFALSMLSRSTNPRDLWSFNSTNRGMSTFVTSLQVLFKEIARERCSLDGIGEALLELTHFPPVVLALEAIYESGFGNHTQSGPLLLVASAFYALCRMMVPQSMCVSSENALEASRQVMCWLYCLRSEASITNGEPSSLVYRAQIRDSNNEEFPDVAPAFKPFQEVDIRIPSLNRTSHDTKTLLVSIEEGEESLCQLLGLAIHTNGFLPWNHYFQPANGWNTLWNQEIVQTPPRNQFSALIDTANSVEAFRVVGPLQLGVCLAVELPVITLSATGYVSKYDHEDMLCGERRFITWNPVEKKVSLPENPGQFLMQKLDPIVVQRKRNREWELDAWPVSTASGISGAPDEAIVICVDISLSMNEPMDDTWIPDQDSSGADPTRLDEVKEFFKNLSLRISALNLSTHLGLVTFSSGNDVVVRQPLTPIHLNFNQQLNNITPRGRTAIFNALDTAKVELENLKDQFPQTNCRIILLTDGEDNNSSVVPSNISGELLDANIVLDAVVIGEDQTANLFRICKQTGGYAFAPQTQQALFQIFLLETMIDIRTRPDIIQVQLPLEGNWEDFEPKAADMTDPFDFPPCRPHPNIDDYFIALADADRFMGRSSRRSSVSVSTTVSGAGGTSRILLGEIRAAIANPHNFIDIYVSQSNMGFWKVVMQGPPNSPYSKGIFLLYVEIGDEFPRRPPQARFLTPVLHPNITKVRPIGDLSFLSSAHAPSILELS